MKLKKTTILTLAALSVLSITGCNSQATPDERPSVDLSVSENGGMGKNENQDTVNNEDVGSLLDILNFAATCKTYSYSQKVNVGQTNSEFVDYFTPNAWYEDNLTNESASFGYGQNKTKEMFKFWLDEKGNTSAGLFEYVGYSSLEIATDLYNPLNIASMSLLKIYLDGVNEENLTTFAKKKGANKYIILDDNIQSVFQFMTTYGSSISGKVASYEVQIIDSEKHIFDVTANLAGSYGTIVSRFTPLSETIIDKAAEGITNGTINGTKSYNDVTDFLSIAKKNNYKLEGIHLIKDGVEVSGYSYDINCTNDYFFLNYTDPSYTSRSFGLMFLPPNVEVNYSTYNEDGTTNSLNQTKEYETCYSFMKNDKGYYFDGFIGPVESGNMKYVNVDKLPTTGESNVLYIIEENGSKVVYEWKIVNGATNEYGFEKYSNWYSNIGQFYFTSGTATFYLSAQTVCELGSYYYEKKLGTENEYYTTNNYVLSALANGLFGWGFQATATWMEYITKSTLRVHRNAKGEVESADLGLIFVGSSGGGKYQEQEIYYTFKDFGNANVSDIDAYYSSVVGGKANV